MIESKIYNYFKNIVEENISQGFGLKKTNKRKKLFPSRNREKWIDE